MRAKTLGRWLIVGAILSVPMLTHAQETALSGTVTDTTGGALPGAIVRAVHEASGNSFEAVTDARGDYRLPLRVGTFRLTAELAGFAPVARTLTLLIGQQAVVNLQLSLSGVQESVTVTGEAPLLDVTQSSLGGNIDPRQMQELPVQGRNWMDLTMLAPGAKENAVSGNPSNLSNSQLGLKPGGDFSLNMDGQQVTRLIFGGQPSFSRDTIAEFEFLSSRFDATQGRSSGLQVNAITKSGTNVPGGTFSGYFRDDRFNAADFVAKRVLPYQDQQFSGTFGGPIRKDRVHFFVNYEFERNPRTSVYTTPFPYFNRDISAVNTTKMGGARLDAQFSPQTRLAVRFTGSRIETFGGGGGSSTPSSATQGHTRSNQILTTLTQVLSNRAVNEVKVGYNDLTNDSRAYLLENPRAVFFGQNGPIVRLRGVTAGGSDKIPADGNEQVLSFREDLTYSFEKGGRHTTKLGGEYLHQMLGDFRCITCDGDLVANSRPIPVPVEELFPDLFDATTWNLNPLSSVSIRYRQPFAPTLEAFGSNTPRHTYAAWVQDDWAMSQRLTLNLGLRYDLELNAFVNDVEVLPFLPGNRPNDKNNIAPRLGFNYSLSDRTVLRGGYGLYVGTVQNGHYVKILEQQLVLETQADGRPDFPSNPYNGPTPTYAQVKARLCTPALQPGCFKNEVQTTGGGFVFGPEFTMPFSHQASIGVQRQVGSTMSIEADYVYSGLRNHPVEQLLNLTYNPATGANYPSTDISHRPLPNWGFVSLTMNGYRYNSNALQTAFRTRLNHGWQASGTYTLAVVRDAEPRPKYWAGSGIAEVPFPTAPDLGGEYSLAIGDQRHRAVFNGLWELPYAFQLSGLYFFGSGQRSATSWGADLRDLGTTRFGEQRLRPDGTIIPRNSFVGKPLHRVDLRLQRRFPLGGRMGIDGLFEVYNVVNHTNYGSYVVTEFSANYGQPQQSTNVAYLPRTLQLGFRFSF